MPNRIDLLPYDGRGRIPACSMFDAVQAGQSASLNPGVTRDGNPMDFMGFRRYRLKIVQLTGAGPTAVNALDKSFAFLPAVTWETAVLAAAQATGVRSVYNFGEGTAILQNWMGPFLQISLTNNGVDAATYELELWAQA